MINKKGEVYNEIKKEDTSLKDVCNFIKWICVVGIICISVKVFNVLIFLK